MLPCHFDSFITVAGVKHLPAALIEHRRKHPAAIGVIIDDQDSFHEAISLVPVRGCR